MDSLAHSSTISPDHVDSVRTRVRTLIAEATRRTVDGVPLEARLDATGLGLDSLGLIKLSVRLEEAFEITMPDIAEYEGAASLGTVLQLADFVAARVATTRRVP